MDIVVENSKKLIRDLYLLLKDNKDLNLEEPADQEEEQKIRRKKYSLYKEMNKSVKDFLVNLVNFEDKKDEEKQEEKMEYNQNVSVKQTMLLENVNDNLEKNIDAVLLEGKIARILGVEEKSQGILISAVCQEADRKHVMEYTLSYYPSKRNKFVLKINV